MCGAWRTLSDGVFALLTGIRILFPLAPLWALRPVRGSTARVDPETSAAFSPCCQPWKRQGAEQGSYLETVPFVKGRNDSFLEAETKR